VGGLVPGLHNLTMDPDLRDRGMICTYAMRNLPRSDAGAAVGRFCMTGDGLDRRRLCSTWLVGHAVAGSPPERGSGGL